MKRIETELPGVCVIEPVVHGDHRGFFMETYNQRSLETLGVKTVFVQDNQACSAASVLRGLHYQIQRPQAKLVRVISGEVYDVAVDVRRGSPTFGRYAGIRLSAENKRMFFIPAGFAHGYVVISDSAECCYKCSEFYDPADERGVLWSDPDIGIDWPLPAGTQPVLSPKDAGFPNLSAAALEDLPRYEEFRS